MTEIDFFQHFDQITPNGPKLTQEQFCDAFRVFWACFGETSAHHFNKSPLNRQLVGPISRDLGGFRRFDQNRPKWSQVDPDGRFKGDLLKVRDRIFAKTGPKHPKNVPKQFLGQLGTIWGDFGRNVFLTQTTSWGRQTRGKPGKPGGKPGKPGGKLRGGEPKHPKNIPKLFLGQLGTIWGDFGRNFENRPDREISAPQVGPNGRFKGDLLKVVDRIFAETGPKHPKNIPKPILGHLGTIWGTFGLEVDFRGKPPPGLPSLPPI